MNRPLSFFGAAPPPSAGSGADLLGARGGVVRPVIGGKRQRRDLKRSVRQRRDLKRSVRTKRSKRSKRQRRDSKRQRRDSKRSKGSKRQRGGFYPSVMGNFIAASSKYIVPMALFAGYKLMTRKARKRV